GGDCRDSEILPCNTKTAYGDARSFIAFSLGFDLRFHRPSVILLDRLEINGLVNRAELFGLSSRRLVVVLDVVGPHGRHLGRCMVACNGDPTVKVLLRENWTGLTLERRSNVYTAQHLGERRVHSQPIATRTWCNGSGRD